MANMPAAEVPIDEALVTRLLREQHPDLAHLPVHTLSNGWDNAVFRLGSDFVVRLPRREIAVQLLRNEQLFLPQIAELTSLPLPVPIRIGRPGAHFPWPWTIGPWFAGRPAIDSAPSEHCGLVGQLAEFVIALHRPAAADAPQNPVRGVPLRRRDRAFRHRMETLDTAHSAQIIAVWEEVLEIPEWQYEPFWIHGDLHSANILVQQQRISAIIDFGDMAGGDPAVDLAAGWILFDAEARSRFEQEVGAALGPDPALWQRARGWALNLGTALLANSDDNPQFRALGDHVVNAVLAD
ncbi:MAG: aminoglycoside phosphotransferase family protein [Renibacterium sp.]|nr:aminoglycoside phosphotransferase family protein [Renibacterium sp.]